MVDFRDRVDRVLNHCKRVIGEDCVYISPSGSEHPIRGIFGNEHNVVDPDTERVISANQPMLGINLFDFKDIDLSRKGKVRIRNLTYNIYDIQDDGQGGSELYLHRVNKNEKVFPKKNY